MKTSTFAQTTTYWSRRRALVLLTASAVSASAIAGTGVAAAKAPTITSAGCPAVTGVFVPGTWETNAHADDTRAVGLLGPVATALTEQFGKRFEFRFPAYAAAAFDGMAYGDSKATGIDAARTTISDVAQRCPAAKFILAGYSQGADAIGEVAASIGCHADPVAAERILAVGLVADPRHGTAGGKLVGPPVEGEGIAGPRPSGFCGLSAVTAEICAQQDKYCATSAASNPILATLGRVLSQPTDRGQTSDAQGGDIDLTKSLVSEPDTAGLAGLPSAIGKLVGLASRGQGDPEALSKSATEIAAVLGSLAGSATRSNLHAPQQTPQARNAQQLPPDLLTGLSQSDLSAATAALAELSAGVGTDLAGSAQRVTEATAPLMDSLTKAAPEVLGQASRVLGLAKPSALLGQVTTVLTHGLELATNLPAVADTLTKLAAAVVDLNMALPEKVSLLHRLFRDLNNSFAPLVAMADGVDLGLVSKFIALIPDATGTAQIASVVVGLLENLDLVALARQAGRLQEDLWAIAQTLTTTGDPVQITAKVAALAPTMLGFATLALNTLTGQKTAPSMAASTAPSPQIPAEAGDSQAIDALAQLTTEGLTAANFLASGVHQDYQNYVIDGQRDTVQWLTDWFAARIRHVTGGV
ncbi:cutinase family protein [Nocardia sp. NPDC050712]|uniref:cutinase family protein n=1 Tax=Nocardia sp. NPDC050712 TaxID=3155518 RepID=UPI0033DFCD39